MGATVSELRASFDSRVDTTISPDQLFKIRQDLRAQYVAEFHSIKEAMEISVALGEDERANSQRAAAARVLKAIEMLDQKLTLVRSEA